MENNTASGSERKARKSSAIWNHFEISPCKKKATCKHCNGTMAYQLATMSNLWRHMKKKHARVDVKNDIPGMTDPRIEVFTVQTVEEVGSEGLQTYEITMKGFEEMDHDDIIPSPRQPHDPEWTPTPLENWKASSANTHSEKKERKRSAVWDHFERSPCKTSGTCMHCGKTIKLGTVSNLARHIRQKHPNVSFSLNKSDHITSYNETEQFSNIMNQRNNEDRDALRNEVDICTEAIEVSVDDINNPLNIIETKTDLAHTGFRNDEINLSNTQASQTEMMEDGEEFDINEYIRPNKTILHSELVDRQLVKMIVKGCHPVSMVEQHGFMEFVKMLNPKYQLPSAQKLAEELIPECYQECEKRAIRSLRAAEGVCLYIDQWKSRSTTYICVTAHLINSECKFESLFLACHVLLTPESSPDISERLLETVNDWEISNKVVAAVTDNSPMVSAAVKLCNWPHIPHFIRGLSKVIHEGLMTAKSLIAKVKSFIEELTSNPEDVAKIYSMQKELKLKPVKLIKKVKGEWSASFITLEMISRFVKLKRSMCLVKMCSDCGVKLTENEWRILEGLVETFAMFKAVKNEMMKEDRVALSKVVYFIKVLTHELNKIKNSLNTYPSDVVYAATVAEGSLKEQFKDLEAMYLISNVVLLDPRLKKYVFVDESESASACSKLKKEVCEVVLPEPKYPEPDPNSFWAFFDEEVRKLNAIKDPIGKGIAELENYLQENLLDRNEDHLVWWHQRSSLYPRLFVLAKKYLCVTAKALKKESISFKTAYMLSQLKYNDSAPSESEVMFLHHNM